MSGLLVVSHETYRRLRELSWRAGLFDLEMESDAFRSNLYDLAERSHDVGLDGSYRALTDLREGGGEGIWRRGCRAILGDRIAGRLCSETRVKIDPRATLPILYPDARTTRGRVVGDYR